MGREAGQEGGRGRGRDHLAPVYSDAASQTADCLWVEVGQVNTYKHHQSRVLFSVWIGISKGCHVSVEMDYIST